MKQKSNLLHPGLEVSLAGMNDPDHSLRNLAARQLTDFSRSLGEILAPAIAGVVVMAFLAETDPAAAESQLYVLSDICMFQHVPAPVTKAVTDRLESGTCEEWEIEYIQEIIDIIGWGSAESDPTQKK